MFNTFLRVEFHLHQPLKLVLAALLVGGWVQKIGTALSLQSINNHGDRQDSHAIKLGVTVGSE